MNQRLAALLLTLLPLLASPAAAQEAATWYEVELIVFRQWEAGGDDAERKRHDLPPLELENLVNLRPADPNQPLTPYARLAPGELRLQGVKQVLEKHRGYEPLLHVGWRQPGLGRGEAAPVAIPPDWQPNPQADAGLHGTIKVYRERFLHAVVDLRNGRYQEAVQVLPDARREMLGSESGGEITEDEGALEILDNEDVRALVEAEGVEAHRQSRRMRSGELHYLDHPTLGVIIQVTPVETAGGGR